MSKRLALPLLVLAMIATACGSGDGDASDPGETSPSTLTEPTTVPTLVPVTFESDPIDAGPIFGSGDVESSTDDDQASDETECVDCDEMPDPDPDQEPDQEPQQRVDFLPAAADQPFCGLFATLDSQPFPSDEDEALVVVRSWLAQLRDVAIDSVASDLDLFIGFLDDAIASNGQLGLGDAPDELETASDRMNDYVDHRCNGAGQIVVDPEPIDQQPADAALSSGLQIPVVEFDAAARSESTPYFGDDLDAGSRGSTDPQAADFCLAVHIINNRPQPAGNDMTELSVGQAYFDAIAPVIPAELADDFDVIDAWLDAVLAAGSFDDVDEPEEGDAISTAVESVNVFIDGHCAA